MLVTSEWPGLGQRGGSDSERGSNIMALGGRNASACHRALSKLVCVCVCVRGEAASDILHPKTWVKRIMQSPVFKSLEMPELRFPVMSLTWPPCAVRYDTGFNSMSTDWFFHRRA